MAGGLCWSRALLYFPTPSTSGASHRLREGPVDQRGYPRMVCRRGVIRFSRPTTGEEQGSKVRALSPAWAETRNSKKVGGVMVKTRKSKKTVGRKVKVEMSEPARKRPVKTKPSGKRVKKLAARGNLTRLKRNATADQIVQTCTNLWPT